jgi:shikimate dehydrogenase
MWAELQTPPSITSSSTIIILTPNNKMPNNQIKAAVIGDPIAQSLSPVIHNYFLKKYQINGSYEAIKITQENLLSEVKSLINQGFAGFNVTIPHKEEIFKICDFKSKTALAVGAINTVIITPDKKLFGHNSDVDGFLNNLKDLQKDFDLANKNVFVIGAGGAARAIIYALIKSKVAKIFITNRNKNRALELIKNFPNCEIVFLEMVDFENHLNQCDLLVNSTSLGMLGQEPLRINLKNLKKSSMVYDIVYKPLITDLLNSANLQGNKIITGIGMLLHQALIGFEAWYKTKPEIDQEIIKKLYEIH